MIMIIISVVIIRVIIANKTLNTRLARTSDPISEVSTQSTSSSLNNLHVMICYVL